MLRPRPARWFEVLTARDDATLVLEALARTGAIELEARTGAVELETRAGAVELESRTGAIEPEAPAGGAASHGRPGATPPTAPAEMRPLLAHFAELAARYGAYWPAAADCRPSPFPDAPAHALRACLATLQAWALQAEPVIRAWQRAQADATELQLWQRVLAARAAGAPAAPELSAAGPLLQLRLFVLPPGSDLPAALAPAADGLDALASPLFVDGVPHLLVAGPPAALRALAQRVSTLKGSSHELPPWLADAEPGHEAAASERLRALQAEQARARAQLQALEDVHGLRRALGNAHRLQWLLDNVHALESGRLLCWITGWCSDTSGQALPRALQASGARALWRFAPPPEGAHAPLLLSNPPWARPFEIFSRALGMPASAEADPSTLLAVAVPLLFGYMFGDVGQGLLLAAGGWCLRERFAVARLLMVGGLSAAAFGLLFGSVFGLHGLLPALWLEPLHAPLAVLAAPLAGGALLLTLGLGLDALAAWWRHELRRWLLTDAWLLVVYLGLLTAYFAPAAGVVAAGAAVAYCAGHAVHHGHIKAAFAAIGELIEKTLQILINTLSFARVGAFALAHAGLSSALVALMAAADSSLAKAALLLLGNALIIVLEAMVVSIQTTRLVLFEFFTRFMQGKGRAFRPLPAPPYTTQEI